MPDETAEDYRKRCDLLDLETGASDEEIFRAFEKKASNADKAETTKLRFAKDYLLNHDSPDA